MLCIPRDAEIVTHIRLVHPSKIETFSTILCKAAHELAFVSTQDHLKT